MYQEGIEYQYERARKEISFKDRNQKPACAEDSFPIVVTTVVALFVPSAVPLIGMLMFGNLVKEIGSDTSRLFDAASNSIMNAATIFWDFRWALL